MRRPADVLTLGRLVLAAVLPLALAAGGALPLVLWTLAAASDYAGGPLARRSAQATARGMMLDNVADIAFVLGGLATAAALGLVPWLIPGTVLLSAVDYGRTLLEERRGVVRAGLARSGVGHAAACSTTRASVWCVGGSHPLASCRRPTLLPLSPGGFLGRGEAPG